MDVEIWVSRHFDTKYKDKSAYTVQTAVRFFLISKIDHWRLLILEMQLSKSWYSPGAFLLTRLIPSRLSPQLSSLFNSLQRGTQLSMVRDLVCMVRPTFPLQNMDHLSESRDFWP